jgi:hypothetical protein
MSNIHESMGQYTVELTKHVPDGDNCYRPCNIGTRTGIVEIMVDFDKLKELAHKALKNKNRKSRIASGGITFRVRPGSEIERLI